MRMDDRTCENCGQPYSTQCEDCNQENWTPKGLRPGVSYYITLNGYVHKVPSAQHNAFAQKMVEEKYLHLLKLFLDKPTMYLSEACKDILTGMLGWISFTPLGDNTYVGYIGRKRNNEEQIWVKFTKRQKKTLEMLWVVNGNKPEKLQQLFIENEFLSSGNRAIYEGR
jgi:hypothetical protein